MARPLSHVPPFHRPAPVRRRRRFGIAPALAFALAKAVAVVAIPMGLAAWLWASPYFLVQEIEVRAGERVPAQWVEATLAPFRGQHVLEVSLEAVRHRLAAHPWVESVELRKELPDRLRVEVVERQPAALLRTGEGMFYVDALGEAISRLPEGGDPGGLVVLRHASGGAVPVAAALALVAELEEARAGWGAAVSEIVPLGEGDFRVELEPLSFSLLLRAGTLAEGLERLPVAERKVARRGVEIATVDLRFPRRILIQPASPAPGLADRNGSARTEG